MVAQGKPQRQRVKRFTLKQIGIELRQLVADRIKSLLPNAGEFVIVTRKGRAEVQVKVNEGEAKA